MVGEPALTTKGGAHQKHKRMMTQNTYCGGSIYIFCADTKKEQNRERGQGRAWLAGGLKQTRKNRLAKNIRERESGRANPYPVRC